MNEQDWKKQWKFLKWIMIVFKPLEFLVRSSTRRGIMRLLNKEHLENPKILELGAGTGKESAWLVKKFGGSTTLVDNCDTILQYSKKYFSKKQINVSFVNKDIMKLNVREKYDLVLSVGLIEHFYGSDLTLIFDKHIESIKKGGYAITFTPRACPLYYSYRGILTILGLWMWDEKPFTKEDFINLSRPNKSKLISTTNVIFGTWIGALYKKE